MCFGYRQDKVLYKQRIKEEQACEITSFTNDLHDASSFWAYISQLLQIVWTIKLELLMRVAIFPRFVYGYHFVRRWHIANCTLD